MKRLRNALLIAATLVMVVVALAAGAIYYLLTRDTTELSTTTGDLAFMSDRAGNWDIWLREPGGALRNLTGGADSHEYFFNFTFDGEVVNFYSTRGGGSDPALVHIDGSGFKTMNYVTALVEVLESGRTAMDPAWSPDGSRVVWSAVRGVGVRLFIANADFTNERELTGEGTTNNMQAWSPDGTRVVFSSSRDDHRADLFVIDVASGEVTKLTTEGYDLQPVWSMDGSQILFISERDIDLSTGTFEYYIMNADGSDLRPFGPGEVFTGDPTTSPDGAQVAYMSNASGSWHIYLMDADGSNVRQITAGASNNLFPAWRPVPAAE